MTHGEVDDFLREFDDYADHQDRLVIQEAVDQQRAEQRIALGLPPPPAFRH